MLTDDGSPTIEGIPQLDDFYWVLGLARDGDDITSLCLIRNAPGSSVFVLDRR